MQLTRVTRYKPDSSESREQQHVRSQRLPNHTTLSAQP